MSQCTSPCERAAVGFSWTRRSDGSWKRLLIRECFRCRERTADEIHYVDISSSMCSWCFGQNINNVATEEGLVATCADCNGTDMWFLEPPEPPEPDEDYEDEEI